MRSLTMRALFQGKFRFRQLKDDLDLQISLYEPRMETSWNFIAKKDIPKLIAFLQSLIGEQDEKS